MKLPSALREQLVQDMDTFLDAYSSGHDCEAIANYVIEVLEEFADDRGLDDVVAELEEEGELDGTLAEELENEMRSNDEFEFTGEEVTYLLETMCGVEWDDSALDDEEDILEEDEDEDEDEDEEL